jgi:hypothetical protein
MHWARSENTNTQFSFCVFVFAFVCLLSETSPLSKHTKFVFQKQKLWAMGQVMELRNLCLCLCVCVFVFPKCAHNTQNKIIEK